MPTLHDTPVALKAFEFHGIDFVTQTDIQAIASDCPFCGKPKKFYVNCETGQWDCKSCACSGNTYEFFSKLWEVSKDSTSDKEYGILSLDRHIKPETLKVWGVCKSPISGEWLMPGFSPGSKLIQLYRYVKRYDMKKDKHYHVLMATPGLGSNGNLTQAIFGMNLFNPDAKTVYVCEGPWDTMALWESLRVYKGSPNSKYKVTANVSESLLANTNVVGTPGAGTFLESWPKIFSNKVVKLGFDSDHRKQVKVKTSTTKPSTPKKSGSLAEHLRNGKASGNGNGHDTGSTATATATVDGAGLAGVKHAVKVLVRAEEEVSGIEYLRWGPEGFDPTKPDGWDIRDELQSNPKAKGEVLKGLLQKFFPVPEEWTKVNGAKNASQVLPQECQDYKRVLAALKGCAKVTDGILRGLAVCLASVISVEQPEDQLWIKLVGPPSSFKTSIVDAIAVSKRHTLMTTVNGFYSGYKSDADGAVDHSLIHKVRNKTLITKDGDTLLQAPNIGQILAEARDIYDKSGGKTYRSDIQRNYQGILMTWILCGTSSLRALDTSELGERFLTTVIMDKIDPRLEFEIGMRKVNQIRSVMGRGKGQSQTNTDKVNKFKALTGGYVEYLRSHADELIDNVEMTDEVAQLCCKLGTFVAYMRARPSPKQDEDVERELCPRLVSQISKLAFCLAAVMQKDSCDEKVMDYVCKVASDTARGKTAKIVKQIHKYGRRGMNLKALSIINGEKESKMQDFLSFLCKIDVLEFFDASIEQGMGAGMRYRIKQEVEDLYVEVIRAAKRYALAAAR